MWAKRIQRYFWNVETSVFRLPFWKRWFSTPDDGVTLVLLTKQHLEVQKIKLSPRMVRLLKVSSFFGAMFLILSTFFFFNYLIHLPENALMRAENTALRRELDNLQFQMDTLQTSMDRITRFDQKLRALTQVDKEFAKRGPSKGVGGPEDNLVADTEFDFGNFQVDSADLQANPEADQMLDRRQAFLVQRIYSWMRELFRNASLQEQSLEELFEVLKGREIELAATPSILPVSGWVTSHFGNRIDPFTERRTFHRGMDIVARLGAPVVSPADGIVTFVGPNGSYGRTVMVFHGYGISTLYAHLSDSHVRQGQRVARGDLLASVGNTGRSTSAHLHYEVVVHGVQVDPRKFVLDRSL